MKVTFDEYVDETKVMDSDDHKYRVTFERAGDITVVSYREYLDADRAGFSGYVRTQVALPTNIIRQIASDLEKYNDA